MVTIDMKIPPGPNFQINKAVAPQGLKHVIEETDPGLNICFAGAIQIDRHLNVGFLGLALYGGFSVSHIGPIILIPADDYHPFRSHLPKQ
jgi:hypothetical protein